MSLIESETTAELERVLAQIRSAVREQSPYLVGGIERPGIKLNQNESPFDVPRELKRALIESFMEIPFNRYPQEQPVGLVRAYAAFAGCEPEGVLAGNGSNELTYTLGLTMLEPGGAVVLPRPMFSLYEKVARLHEAELTSVPSRPDLSFDAEALLEAVARKRPVLTVLATPNNPTGLAMRFADVEEIVAAASPGFVVVDEAYVEFSEEASAASLLGVYPNLILLRTLSKASGLAGLRIGFMLAHPAVIGEVLKARVPFMIDPLSESTARALLAHPDLLRERAVIIKASCRELAKQLRSIEGVDVLPTQANFVLFRTPLEPGSVMNRLAESGVLIRSMAGYPELRGFLRVNAGMADENNAFLVALKTALTDDG